MEKLLKEILQLTPQRKGILLFVIAAVMTVPWLGLTEFNTKGEPREAVVSMSMLQQDNWVLPTNNDVDIPYKPMMFHWTGGVVARLTGGNVTEFTSRLPSALTLALLVGGSCWFFARYSGRRVAPMLASAIMLTCFELHRSGVSARVDMTLTFWMVSAFFLLYRWWIREHDGEKRRFLYRIPWLAILCLSAATLSKGPVGILLPLLSLGIFMLVKRDNVVAIILWTLLFCALALILPSWWYYSAWQQGGDNFLSLVLEENFGRMTGGMTYESHENPWHYNFWITAVGFLPWTLLAITGGLAMLIKRNPADKECSKSSFTERLLWRGNDISLYSLVALATVMIFFCIPSSKRSVYLLPAYPFIAWFASEWFLWLARNRHAASIRIYGAILATVAVIVEVLFVGLHLLPDNIELFSGRKAAANNAMVDALASSGIISWILVGLLFAAGVVWFVWHGKLKRPVAMLGMECVMLFFLFTTLDGGLQPPLLNTKSLKDDAEKITEIIGDQPIYEYIRFGEEATANRYHFFELNFYLEDRMKNFVKHEPVSGYLAMPDDNIEWVRELYSNKGYRFEPVYKIDRPARKEKVTLYWFERKKI